MRIRSVLPLAALLLAVGCKKNNGETGDTGPTYETGCITVDGTGGFKWLQDAITVAEEGAVIALCEDPLDEKVELDKSVDIVGLGRNEEGAWQTSWSWEDDASTFAALTIVGPVTVNITGVEILPTISAILIGTEGTLVLDDVHLADMGGYGVEATTATVEVNNSVIENTGWGGIRMVGGQVTVTDSVLLNNLAYGVQLEEGAVATISGSTISGTIVSVDDGSSEDGWGVSCRDGATATLSGNTMAGNILGAVEVIGSTLDVTGDTWDENYVGVWAENATVTLTGTEVTNTLLYGALSQNSTLTLVDTNLLANAITSPYEDETSYLRGGYGIVAFSGDVSVTRGEISGHNGGGFYASGDVTENMPIEMTDVVIRDNAGRGGQAQLADVLFTDVDVDETRNDDELCLVDYVYSCNWGVALFDANIEWNGGSLEDNGDLGLVAQNGSVTLDGLSIGDNKNYGVWVIDAALSLADSTVHDTGLYALYLSSSVGILDTVAFENRNHIDSWESVATDGTVTEFIFYYEAYDIYASDSDVTVLDSSFTDGEQGIRGYSSDLVVRDSTFTNYIRYAVAPSGGTATVERTSFTGVGGRAIYCSSSAALSVSQASFIDSTNIPSRFDYLVGGVMQPGYPSESVTLDSVIYADTCGVDLDRVTIDGAYEQGMWFDDAQVDASSVVVKRTGQQSDNNTPAVEIIYSSVVPDVFVNDLEITAVGDGAGLRIHTTNTDAASSFELRGVSVGLDDGLSNSGIEQQGILLSGLPALNLRGFDVAFTGAAGLSVTNTTGSITGIDSLDPTWTGIIDAAGTNGILATDSDLVITDVTVTNAVESGLKITGGTHTVDTVTVAGAGTFGMDCPLPELTVLAAPLDTETLTITDGTTSVIFEFDVAADGIVTGDTAIDASSADPAAIAAEIKAALDASALLAAPTIDAFDATRLQLNLDVTVESTFAVTDGTGGDILTEGLTGNPVFTSCIDNNIAGTLAAFHGCSACAQ